MRKTLESRDWTLDQMQEFQMNYTAKYGTKIPTPKLFIDEGDSEEEGLELDDGTVYGKQAPRKADPKPKPASGRGSIPQGSGRGGVPWGSGRGSGCSGGSSGGGGGGTGGRGSIG